jgi:hypothetical protein
VGEGSHGVVDVVADWTAAEHLAALGTPQV